MYRTASILYENERIRAHYVTDDGEIVQKGQLHILKRRSDVLIQFTPQSNSPETLIPSKVRPFSVEIKDLISYRRIPLSKGDRHDAHGVQQSCRLILMSSDGSSMPPLEFDFHEDFLALKKVLEEHLSITPSTNDELLFLLRRHEPDALFNSYEMLQQEGDSSRAYLHPHANVNQFSSATSVIRNFSTVTSTMAQLFRSGSPVGGHGTPNFIQQDLDALRDVKPVVIPADVSERVAQQQSRMSYPVMYPVHGHPAASSSLTTVPDDDELGYEVVTKRTAVALPPPRVVKRSAPLNEVEWNSHIDEEGRVNNVPALREKIFHGGIEPQLRPLVWKYLLGYYSWNLTLKENEARRESLHQEYRVMKKQWQTMTPEQEKRNTLFRDRKSLIEKDVNRTDRSLEFYKDFETGNLTVLSDILMTYSMYNFDLGYVQGMNDLLAPLLLLVPCEEDAFWYFAGFMEKMKDNFEQDQAGIKRQFSQLYSLLQVLNWDLSEYLRETDAQMLYFSFRWLLVHFKREFTYQDTMRLWEVLWSEHLAGCNFHLFFAAAILVERRYDIMDTRLSFTAILKYINDQAYRIPLDVTLEKAEVLYLQLRDVKEQLPEVVVELLAVD